MEIGSCSQLTKHVVSKHTPVMQHLGHVTQTLQQLDASITHKVNMIMIHTSDIFLIAELDYMTHSWMF